MSPICIFYACVVCKAFPALSNWRWEGTHTKGFEVLIQKSEGVALYAGSAKDPLGPCCTDRTVKDSPAASTPPRTITHCVAKGDALGET